MQTEMCDGPVLTSGMSEMESLTWCGPAGVESWVGRAERLMAGTRLRVVVRDHDLFPSLSGVRSALPVAVVMPARRRY